MDNKMMAFRNFIFFEESIGKKTQLQISFHLILALKGFFTGNPWAKSPCRPHSSRSRRAPVVPEAQHFPQAAKQPIDGLLHGPELF
jgi:hypothetical protein